MKIARPIGLAGTVIAAGVAVFAVYSVLTWVRYGKVHPERHPADVLLDQFMPHPEVDEYHSVEVPAPAALALETAKRTDVQSALPIKAIFFLRAIPALLRGEEFRPKGPRGLFEETLAQGFGVLAEEPGIEVVIGTYCQPWHQDVEFRPLPPEEFAAFDDPGFVKIAVSLAAEPLGPGSSRFVTRTRVVTTDAEARRKFRLYWSPMSAGILLIRWFFLPLVRKQAERLATA
ncbi:MAG: hypothetical protein ACXVBG_23790 [Isosphaeraceae bacterium]